MVPHTGEGWAYDNLKEFFHLYYLSYETPAYLALDLTYAYTTYTPRKSTVSCPLPAATEPCAD